MKLLIAQLVLAAAAGAVVGSLYFGGLWLTVRRMPSARRPLLLAVVSFLLRAAVAIAVMILLARRNWQLLAAFLVGFLVLRLVLVPILCRGAADEHKGEDEQARPDGPAGQGPESKHP